MGWKLRALPLVLLAAACSDHGLTGKTPDGPTQANVLVDPLDIDLGMLGAGDQVSVVLRVRNTGDAILHLDRIWLDQGSSGLMLVAPELPGALAPGTEVQAILTFTGVVQQVEDVVHVRSDDPDSPQVDVPVRAGAELPQLAIDPNPVDFGEVAPGEDRRSQVALRNTGNVDLVIDRLLLVADEMQVEDAPPLPLILAPGQDEALTVRFGPSTRGDQTGQLWVGSNSWLGDQAGALLGHGGWPGISGRICDPSGDGWVIDARVFAEVDQDGDGTVDWTTETQTAANGSYTLRDLPPGTWTVQVEKGSYRASFQAVADDSGGVTEQDEDTCLDPDSVRIAVVTGEWDHIESLVSQLGLSYDAYPEASGLRSLLSDDVESGASLDDYDVLFIDCGDYRSLSGELRSLSPRLLRWVQAGGSLYASDWAWQAVEVTWPELADFYGEDTVFEGPAVGMATEIDATVEDTTMAYAVGSSTAEISYNLDGWMVIDAAGEGTTVLVRGDVPTYRGDVAGSPLAIRAEPGGRVIYTTFHNEQQITGDMDAALREIILSL